MEIAGSDAMRGVGGRGRLRGVPSEDCSKLEGVSTDSDSVDSVAGSEDNNSVSELETGRLSVGSVGTGTDDGVGTWRDSEDEGKDGIGEKEGSVGGNGTSSGNISEIDCGDDGIEGTSEEVGILIKLLSSNKPTEDNGVNGTDGTISGGISDSGSSTISCGIPWSEGVCIWEAV